MTRSELHVQFGVVCFALFLITSSVFAPLAGAIQTSQPAHSGDSSGVAPSSVEIEQQQNTTTLSGAVKYQLSQAEDGDKIPVILVFDKQPQA
ncbi:hypothetical protein, partial [Haloferax profundi]|uniref:hypothetical protein n=1 Tax=Haloferax profundi TaxID=1544718 RepID=UPI00373FDDB5